MSIELAEASRVAEGRAMSGADPPPHADKKQAATQPQTDATSLIAIPCGAP
jgi:hypothetical protein